MSVKAPWTPEQVANLNDWQTSRHVHPFTCPMHDDHRGHIVLIATTDGWVCGMQECSYTQDWAHDRMTQPRPSLNWLDRAAGPSPTEDQQP